MIAVADFLRREAPKVRLLLQVHDELLFEGPEAELRRVAEPLAEIMADAHQLKAPLHVDLTRYHALEQVASWVGGLASSLDATA